MIKHNIYGDGVTEAALGPIAEIATSSEWQASMWVFNTRRRAGDWPSPARELLDRPGKKAAKGLAQNPIFPKAEVRLKEQSVATNDGVANGNGSRLAPH